MSILLVAHHRQVDKTLVSIPLLFRVIMSLRKLLASLKQIHFLSGLYWKGGILFGSFHFWLSSTLFAISAVSKSSDKSENEIPFQNQSNSFLFRLIFAFCHQWLLRISRPFSNFRLKSY